MIDALSQYRRYLESLPKANPTPRKNAGPPQLSPNQERLMKRHIEKARKRGA